MDETENAVPSGAVGVPQENVINRLAMRIGGLSAELAMTQAANEVLQLRVAELESQQTKD